MCGRFYVDDETAREIENMIRKVDDRVNGAPVPNGDIYPTGPAAVISGQGTHMQVNIKKWGFPSPFSKNTIINARAESVLSKKMFSDSIQKRRLIIPSSGFYEWNSAKEKVTFSPYASHSLYMAGFYNHFENEDRFIILTTAANDSVKATHNRMPLTLEPEELEAWLFDEKSLAKYLSKTPDLLHSKQDYTQQTLSL